MPAVREYFRSDGTRVRGHWRNAAGAGRELAVFGAIVLALMAFGSKPAATPRAEPGPGRLPQPRPSAVYPVEWPGWDKPLPKPTPTVSYPIVFPKSSGR